MREGERRHCETNLLTERESISLEVMTHAVIVDASRSESTCASSEGGPGLKRGAHKAGRSIFGTRNIPRFERHIEKR